ncbi:MAG: LysR family transcriptional regulator [Gammaproteobacteria bacterium]|nr:LysR family transcriptional regulator [Gammaproteobacteria bacterium]MCP4982728.1 LysR family transcriptional regulator [Gammaproteobacteria bacterium]
MQLINLRTFITVSKTGGFHAAAERLNITQAAVSARIRALEDQLGQRLFDRGRRGASLTVAGREFLPHAENISHTWDHARSMLGAPVSRPVPLRIGSQFSTWAQLVLDWAGWIINALPETELYLDFDFSRDMLNAMQKGELDIAISSTLTPTQGMRSLALTDETLVLVASRPTILGDEQMPPYIQMDWGPQFNSEVARLENHLPHSRLSIGNGEMGLRYVLEHDCCGYFPLRTIRALMQQNRLYRVKRAPRFPFSGQVIYSEDNPNRLFIERAIDWLKGIEPNPAIRDAE